jgi:cytochrome c553
MNRCVLALSLAPFVMALSLVGCYESTELRPIPGPTRPGADASVPIGPRPVRDAGTPGPSGPMLAPIGGGSVELTSAGLAIVADSDRASVSVVDLAARTVVSTFALGEGDDPGRMAIDGAGHVHVVLRGSGELVDIDLATPSSAQRRPLCSAPRGIAWEASTDLLHVACAGGELVSLRAAGGAAVRTLVLADDLRDVVAADGVLYVSRFRDAELLVVSPSGAIVRRQRPRALHLPGPRSTVDFRANVAWRLRAMPGGGVAMLHQQAMTSPIDVDVDGYMGVADCLGVGVVAPSMSIFTPDGGVAGGGLITAPALLVDFGVVSDGSAFYFATATQSEGRMLVPVGGVFRVARAAFATDCVMPEWGEEMFDEPAYAMVMVDDESVASLRPSGVRVGNPGRTAVTTSLPSVAEPAGRRLFDRSTVVGLACASCHPEGGEDGHIWDFQPVGPRRTQTLLGGLLGHEPFHWNGDQADMQAIMQVTFGERMLGDFGPTDVTAIGQWLDAQPAIPGVAHDPAGIARGRALFERADVGCSSCHSGAAMTNDRNEDVGTGGSFQVPSLVGVMHRAPFLHHGCAPDLGDVVAGACAETDAHGRTSALTESERADLVTYLRSL